MDKKTLNVIPSTSAASSSCWFPSDNRWAGGPCKETVLYVKLKAEPGDAEPLIISLIGACAAAKCALTDALLPGYKYIICQDEGGTITEFLKRLDQVEIILTFVSTGSVPGYSIVRALLFLFESRFISNKASPDFISYEEVSTYMGNSLGVLVTKDFPEYLAQENGLEHFESDSQFGVKCLKTFSSSPAPKAKTDEDPLACGDIVPVAKNATPCLPQPPVKENSIFLISCKVRHIIPIIHEEFRRSDIIISETWLKNLYDRLRKCKPSSTPRVYQPLEHLISCVPGAEILVDNGVKILRKIPPRVLAEDHNEKRRSGDVTAKWTKKITDFLRNSGESYVHLDRVQELFGTDFQADMSMPILKFLQISNKTFQVVGLEKEKYVMIAHYTQMKKFVADVVRIIRSGTEKFVTADKVIPQLSSQSCPNRDPLQQSIDFVKLCGVCCTEDLIITVPTSWGLECSTFYDDEGRLHGDSTFQSLTLSIPIKPQSESEKRRTMIFREQVKSLLAVTGKESRLFGVEDFSIPFHKFVPAYHKKFGRQCRVEFFGCRRLMELLDYIDDVVSVFPRSDPLTAKISLKTRAIYEIVERRLCATKYRAYPSESVAEAYGSDFTAPSAEMVEEAMSLSPLLRYGTSMRLIQSRTNLTLLLDPVLSVVVHFFLENDCSLSAEEISERYQKVRGEPLGQQFIPFLRQSNVLRQVSGGRYVLYDLMPTIRNIVIFLKEYSAWDILDLKRRYHVEFGRSIEPQVLEILPSLPYFSIVDARHQRYQMIILSTYFHSLVPREEEDGGEEEPLE